MHKGQVIQKAVKESGVAITQLAKKLGKSRQWIYNIFESSQVSVDVIIEVGKAIHHDFSNDFKQLKKYVQPGENNKVEEDNVEYWREKYIKLLEEYNQLLKKKKK